MIDDNSSRSVNSSRSATKQDNFFYDVDPKVYRKPKPLKRLRSRVGSSSRNRLRVFIPWLLSFLLALSLFTTFTYMPPDLPDQHPHIIHNDVQGAILPPSTKAAAPARVDEAKANSPAQASEANSKEKVAVPDETINYGKADLAALKLDLEANSVILNQVPADHPMHQNPIMSVLSKAMVSEISLDDWKNLPDLAKNLVDLYGPRIFPSPNGDGPIVLGKETCEAYRKAVPLNERYVGAAGMFNTGTNALEHHLTKNINITSVWQIPWGKHRMEWQRLKHVASGMQNKDQSKALPVVIVRDPFTWLQSMCRSPYAAHWKHRGNRCPNLFADENDLKKFKDIGEGQKDASTFVVKVIFDKDDVQFFDSLADLWSTWYGRYYNASYPHLIVRFEDMLLQAPAILAQIAECVGTTVRDPILYQQGSAKAHGSHTDFLKAVLKTADREKRAQGLTKKDLEYAATALDKNLMNVFQYNLIS